MILMPDSLVRSANSGSVQPNTRGEHFEHACNKMGKNKTDKERINRDVI